MKLLLSAVVLFAIGFSVDVWTPFLNEEGEEFDISQFEGLELSRFERERGGNGGGAWTDDCEAGGGIKTIYMECGTYVGMMRLQCVNGWKPQRGLGYGPGDGKRFHIWGHGITKVEIRAGAYVDKATFYRGNHKYHTCGSSNGGSLYRAVAPAGMTLCGLKGRSGHWMDKLAAGWCQYKRDCKVGNFGAWGGCSNYKQTRTRSVTQTAQKGGKACPSLSESQCCEMNGHRCKAQNQCCGKRCCSRWGWCGGSRDGKYDAWCGSKMHFMNHVAGFAHEMGDISVGITGVFAAVIFLPSFAAYKFFSRRQESAEFESLL